MDNGQTTSPQFELITGPTGSFYFFQDEIVERVHRTQTTDYDFIYFLPVKRAVRRFKERLMDALPAHALSDPPVYTFYEFMLEAYRSQPGARKIISPAMQLFLVEEVLRQNVHDLRFFSRENCERRGLVRKVNELLTELREYGYSAEELLENDDAEDVRIHDFSLLLRRFDEALGEQLYDEAGAIQNLASTLHARLWQQRFPDVRTIYLNGYGMFTRPMLNFIATVRSVCDVKVKLDYFDDQPHLFEHLQRAYFDLKGLNPLERAEKSPQPWEENLFRRTALSQKYTIPGRNVLIQPARNRREEIAFMAAYIKRLHRQENIPLNQIAVTFPSLEEYAPLIHEIFGIYGVPYNLSTGYPLSQSPLIRTLLLVLEIPLKGYEVKKLMQLLASPFYRPPEDSRLTPGRLKQMSLELRLTHLSGAWQEKMQRHLDYLEGASEEGEEDDLALQRKREHSGKYRQMAAELQLLLDQFAVLDKSQGVTAFRDALLQLLENLGFLDWYRVDNAADEVMSLAEQEREYRAFNRFSKLLDQFSWIVGNLHTGGKAAVEPRLSLKQLHHYMMLLVSDATYNVREWSRYGVQIMPRLEVLSMYPKVLFFGGMIENSFPRPFTHDVFFNDEKREQLGLAATEDLLAQDRYMFYQLLSAPLDRLIFTFPRFEREAARVPSNFLNILTDRLTVRYRGQTPSARFLRTSRQLAEQIAARIPPGVREQDLRMMQHWRRAFADDPQQRRAAEQWLQNVTVNYNKRRREVFNEYEGMLSAEAAITQQLDERFRDSTFSVTRLESYAFCPIQFFFRYLLKLQEDEEPESGMTALERGQLVHNTLFRFYSHLRAEQPHLLLRPWEAREQLFAIAEEEFARLPFSGLLFELEKERYFGAPGRPGLWEVFLVQEREQIETLQYYPAFFEVAFGQTGVRSEQDAVSLAEPLELQRGNERVRLVGKVDRVDLDAGGKKALLLDYKTGNAASRARDVRDGLSLQLAVYALVLPRLLEQAGQQPAEAVLTAIYQVRDAEACERKPVMFDRDAGLNLSERVHAALPNAHVLDSEGNQLTFRDLLQSSEEQVFSYVQSIRAGVYRYTRFPEEPACETWCEFRRMCRKNVRKLVDAG